MTSDTLRENGLPVNIQAEEYTMPGLVAAIVSARLRRLRFADSAEMRICKRKRRLRAAVS